MHRSVRKVHEYHKKFWTWKNAGSLLVGVCLLAIALVIQGFADRYVSHVPAAPAGDILLSRLPILDIDSLIIQSTLFITFLTVFLCLYKPKYLSFVLKSYALFLVIRAVLISLTHLGAYPNQLVLNHNDWGYWLYNILYNTSNDYFFSAHTGVPFLMALIFWPEKIWRYLYLLATVFFGASMLIARIHYSIDVFAAPFMAYSIYSLAIYFFSRDFKLSREEG
ncbi:MAG: phosphatase PAP2-related protein [Minisyncoccia bacterium]|jgi:hypothetical protein